MGKVSLGEAAGRQHITRASRVCAATGTGNLHRKCILCNQITPFLGTETAGRHTGVLCEAPVLGKFPHSNVSSRGLKEGRCWRPVSGRGDQKLG